MRREEAGNKTKGGLGMRQVEAGNETNRGPWNETKRGRQRDSSFHGRRLTYNHFNWTI